MRTTLDIDDDVLVAAKERARHEHKTAGQVISELSRRALSGQVGEPAPPAYRSGFRPFGRRGTVVTNAQIDKLRNESGV